MTAQFIYTVEIEVVTNSIISFTSDEMLTNGKIHAKALEQARKECDTHGATINTGAVTCRRTPTAELHP